MWRPLIAVVIFASLNDGWTQPALSGAEDFQASTVAWESLGFIPESKHITTEYDVLVTTSLAGITPTTVADYHITITSVSLGSTPPLLSYPQTAVTEASQHITTIGVSQNITTARTSQYTTIDDTSQNFTTTWPSQHITTIGVSHNITTARTSQYTTIDDTSQNFTTTWPFQNITTVGVSQNKNTARTSQYTTIDDTSQNFTTTWPFQNITTVVTSQNITTTGTSQSNTAVMATQTTTVSSTTTAINSSVTEESTADVNYNATTTTSIKTQTSTQASLNATAAASTSSSTANNSTRPTTTPRTERTSTSTTTIVPADVNYNATTTTSIETQTSTQASLNATAAASTSSTTANNSTRPTTTPRIERSSTSATTIVPDSEKRQRELYLWGDDAGDFVIQQNADNDYYWGYGLKSQPIYFTGGVPFGSDKFSVAYVLTNGVITFGTQSWAWWPNLEYAYQERQSILAPFWFETNYRQPGKVYYQLHERKDISVNSSRHKNVLDRATNEVKEFYGVKHFKAMAVLVATWDKVEPYCWYTWLCEYYKDYKNSWWWQAYYSHLYEDYCVQQNKVTNTFQAVYITDGQEAYAIVTYKFGEMKWRYEMWRPIAVGFATSDDVRDYGVTKTDLTTKMDSIVWNTGRYGTWMEQVGKIVNPDSRCLDFYLENLHLITSSTHQKLVNDLFECPCSLDRLGRQWWSYSWDQVPGSDRTYRVCYAIGITAKTRLERLRGNPLNKLCCYLWTYPSSWYWEDWLEAYRSASYIHYRDPKAGHLLLNDPWNWWGSARKSREEDFNPHKWCCEDSSSPSKFCTLFNHVRPDFECSPDAEFITGAALGDPHIKTLDGQDYTLNGLGEYILLSVPEQDLMLQGRTQQALNSQGNKTSATVFVAFAVREGNSSTFQVELNTTQTGMVITACGVDITTDFYKRSNYSDSQGDNSVSVTREDKNNRTSVIASFPSGISVEVFVGMKNLEFSTSVPKLFRGKTRGLLGNFNGDPNDEFILPDGKILTVNETDTERKVFYNFGKEWEVTTGNSVFKYPEGESALDYQFSAFEPIFREEVNQTTLNEAKKFCGEENAACIFDYIATKDEKFAANTKSINAEANTVRTSQVNNLPVLSLAPNQLNSEQQWEVTHGQPARITFQVNDADVDDVITYLLKGHSHNAVIDTTGVVTYTPDSNIPVVIGVQARDSKGGLSSIIYLDIAICPTCSGHGVCNKNRTREDEKEGGKFVLYVCNCQPAYTGDDCEKEVDACASSPCSRGQNCTDLTAAEQGDNEIGYVCGQCPSGFMQQDKVCADINECITNGTSPVCSEHASCTNTVGSYLCSCDLGFREDTLNRSRCKDVDECSERTHKCEHICQNSEGSYSCSCFDGNALNSDGKTCRTVSSTGCPACKHACVVKNGTTSCDCRTGYNLVGETDCVDVNECSSANNPCSQACQNTEGRFACSCYPGYKLAEDGVSCTACERPYYGDNCASMCVCNGRGACNHIRGCLCSSGWMGPNCNQDVDECRANSTACPSEQICTNTIGSHSCSCPSGYDMNNGRCEDINECLDVLNHNCSLSVEDCINNKGSYSCRCREGFARGVSGVCEDIDECATKIHDCEQVCENMPGKYNCKCYYGYKLDTDRTSCVKRDTDVCAGVTNLTCEYICTIDLPTSTPYCKCNSGYGLSGEEKCMEINECQFNHLNLCGYKDGCINTDGGYRCSCLPGSMLDNDGRSCVACSGGKWGLKCAEDCACSTGASHCDPIRGCVCKSGYTGTYCEKDIDECSTGLVICKAKERCVNTPGSALCECLPGYARIDGSCQDIDECASVSTNDCDQACENYEGGYLCACNVGYQFNSINKSCQDINECNLKLDGCEQICENSNGGYRCSCSDGLKLNLDGVSCVVASQCINKQCEEKCAVVLGQETCFCSKGKEVDPGDNSTCKDVDMCANNHCSNSGGCIETPGGTGIRCTCPDGQKIAADGYTCVDCTEGTFGANCSQKCACNAATTQSCSKINGTCTCKAGWTSSDCSVDKDECSPPSTLCPDLSKCINTPGSYVCKCDDGYYSTNNRCQECPFNTFGEECRNQCTCDTSHSTCNRVSGLCNCHAGWSGVNCESDVNECLEGNSCTAANKEHWVCFNTPGNYTCGCKTGYELDTTGGICIDVNECAADFSNECDQNCKNTDGNYSCSCNSGYQLGSDGRRCDDIDECSQSPAVCQQVCNNQVGGYHCSCQEGYQIRENNLTLCYEAVGIKTEITVSMDVSGKNLREQMSRDYLDLKAVVESALNEEISKTVEGVTSVTVTQMRKGSLIVDATTIIDKTVNPSAGSDMVEAIVLLFQNGVVINGTHYSVTVKVGDLIVNATTDKCLILHAVEPCRDDEVCERNSYGEVYCRKQDDDASVDIPLVVGLSVGLPLGVALIVAVAAALLYKKKFKAQKRVHSREGHYNDSERAPSPATQSYFAVGQSSIQGVAGKGSDKQTLVL